MEELKVGKELRHVQTTPAAGAQIGSSGQRSGSRHPLREIGILFRHRVGVNVGIGGQPAPPLSILFASSIRIGETASVIFRGIAPPARLLQGMAIVGGRIWLSD